MVARLRRALVARSLLVQGSWNPHTLMGVGMAWALAPVLVRLRRAPERGEETLARHAEPFNAHPYLAGVAMGALVRLERDGTDPETVRRFRAALRGPLGALGDSLIWGGWRPALLLAAGVALLLGAHPLVAVGGFLLLFNALHLAVRDWGVRVGLRHGLDVAGALATANLPRLGDRGRATGVLLGGVLAGALLVRAIGALPAPAAWIGAGAALWLLGMRVGRALPPWAPAALTFAFLLTGLAWGLGYG